MKKTSPSTTMKGNQIPLIHLENRIKRVRLLAEQAALSEESRRRMKAAIHATPDFDRTKKKVESENRVVPPRPSRPATELGRKKEDQRRERSTSAKPITQPSTSKEPVRSESKSIERKTKEMSREKSKERNSPYAKRNTSSPASSSDSIQRLMDEVKKLKNENERLRGKVEVDLTNSQDLQEWPRKDLLKLIAQLESKEVRKPVQAAVKKLQEMGDTTSLHDQLKMARETVETLKHENFTLQQQLESSKSRPVLRKHSKSSTRQDTMDSEQQSSIHPASSSRKSKADHHSNSIKSSQIGRLSSQESTTALDQMDDTRSHHHPSVPRLDMSSIVDDDDEGDNGKSKDEDLDEFYEENETNGDEGGKHENGDNGESNGKDVRVITDPALMPRWEYDQIACDIVYATRAAILRKRYMDRWKKDREDAEERRQPSNQK